MHKLVILIEPLEDWDGFEAQWPDFLHLVESLTGLRREATSRVENFLFGKCEYVQAHELFFDSRTELEQAMASPQGQRAGILLQQMTQGGVSLFIAEHKEDDIENIQKYRPGHDETQ